MVRDRAGLLQRLLVIAAVCSLLPACGKPPGPVVLFPADAPPARLGDWGVVVADGRTLLVNDDVQPYTINTPLFSDYASKLRTVWLPPGTSIEWRDSGPLAFPVGTILSKTFYYRDAVVDGRSVVSRPAAPQGDELPRRLDLDEHRVLETRLLVHYAEGWKALPYVWDAAEQEAFLALAGDIETLAFADAADTAFSYVVPDANQCAGCHVTDHTTKALQPIGPEAWQLSRNVARGDDTVNQLGAWTDSGLLSGTPGQLPEGIDWSVETLPLAHRARAYLDSNCAHCHNDRGSADTSALDLRFEAQAGRASGICKPPVAVGRGSGDRPYDIYPGRPDDSILLYRMQHNDPAIAMPELGRSTVHEEAVLLVRDWIERLDGEC